MTSRKKRTGPSVQTSLRKAILIAVQLPENENSSGSLAELERLVTDLGYTVVERFVQKRSDRKSPTYLGVGKIQEIAQLTGGPGHAKAGPETPAFLRHDAHFTVFSDDELTPAQQRNLEMALAVPILDRVQVILKIFEGRARTPESKLEVEWARLEHELPRIRDNHELGDKEGGGGRASRGHSNVELAKQRIRSRIAVVKRELERLKDHAAKRLESRGDVFRVALVGYTNAGKSSLMHQLTGSDVLIQDKLFATLGTTTRLLASTPGLPILLTDTVGFLDRLPHALMASFHSTLAEARDADLVLHVVDAADAQGRAQLELGSEIIKQLGIAEKPHWLLLNKIDKTDEDTRKEWVTRHPEAIPISALDAQQGAELRRSIIGFFEAQLHELTLRVPYAKQQLLAEWSDRVQIVNQDFGDDITLTVKGSAKVLAQLQSRLQD
jgi:GTP-binding protein HflX